MSIELGPLPKSKDGYWGDYTAEEMRAYAAQEVAREMLRVEPLLKAANALCQRYIDNELVSPISEANRKLAASYGVAVAFDEGEKAAWEDLYRALKAYQQSTDQPPGSTPSASSNHDAR